MGEYNMHVIFEALCIGIAAGVSGTVYRCVLAYEPILQWWFVFGNKFEDKWFFNPIWGCEKCISGELALWFYLGASILPAIATHSGQFSGFWSFWGYCAIHALGLLFAITSAIVTAIRVCKLVK